MIEVSWIIYYLILVKIYLKNMGILGKRKWYQLLSHFSQEIAYQINKFSHLQIIDSS